MSYVTSLRNQLKIADSKLYGRLPQIEEFASTLLSYTQGKFPYYTPHDFAHSQYVEENLNWIIPDKMKESFNSHEIFFLIASAWFHDWGMLGEKNEDPEEIRNNHHIRTETFFETMYEKLTFSQHEGRIIGRICKGHRKEDLYSKAFDDQNFGPGITIRIRILSALLRIADETEITHSRVPEVIYYSLNPSDKAKEEFEKHLNITGVGQLDEPHKIYINAVCSDPRAAKALRELQLKIQNELNSIKTILSRYGLNLDVVELKIDARGFIDKPIAFEVDKNRIVEILIGKHLYRKTDAAIRELIQNSIDACHQKLIFEKYEPKIIIEFANSQEIVIKDNGIGMSYKEAKRFLSSIGTSFYQSDEFKKQSDTCSYNPISHFGIGLLSSFLLADGIIIETKKNNEDACKFTISNLSEDWKFEKGALKETGTVITLLLNEEGQKVSILKSLNRYFLYPTIPVYYKEIDSEIKPFLSKCQISDFERFLYDEDNKNKKNISIKTEFSGTEYEAFFLEIEEDYYSNIILFNQGVYVTDIYIESLNNESCFILNIKSEVIDLMISREEVLYNEKLYNFLFSFFNDFFDNIYNTLAKEDPVKYISIISDFLDRGHIREDKKTIEEALNNVPFIKSFINKALFPVVNKGKQYFASLNEIIEQKSLFLYKCSTKNFKDEVSFFIDAYPDETAFFNPYISPLFLLRNESEIYFDIFQYLYEKKNETLKLIDIISIVKNNAVLEEKDYSNILPGNVKLATFGDLSPICVIIENPKISNKSWSDAMEFLGTLFIWSILLENDVHSDYIDFVKEKIFGSLEDKVELEEHKVLIDSSDVFISSIINKYITIDPALYPIIKRYFLYLSFLPFAMSNIDRSCMYFEVIENSEKIIANALKIEKQDTLFNRIKPSFTMYYEYYNKFEVKFDLT